MIGAFFKDRAAAVRHVTSDNPLLFYQLRCFSIYTWLNLAAFFAIVILAYCTTARLAHYLEARQWEEAVAAVIQVGPLDDSYSMDEYSRCFFSTFSLFADPLLHLGQLVAIAVLNVLLLISIYHSYLLGLKQRWDHPSSLHIRLLPTSSSQLQFAMIDLRFFTISICLLIGVFCLITPALPTEIFGRTPEANNYFAWGQLVFWIFAFAGYRTRQFQKPFGQKVWKNPMLRGWLLAVAISIIMPFALSGMVMAIFDYDYITALNYLGFAFIHVSLLVLLVSCWMLKGRLLKQYEGDADER